MRGRAELVSQVLAHARSGLSAREIGDLFKLTRNAVIGICWRNGVRIGATPDGPQAEQRRRSEALARQRSYDRLSQARMNSVSHCVVDPDFDGAA